MAAGSELPSLRLSALKYIEKYQLYQITFYEHINKDAYYSFITPECGSYISGYLEYRKRCGEKLNDNSPLIRDNFIMDDSLHIKNQKIIINKHNYEFKKCTYKNRILNNITYKRKRRESNNKNTTTTTGGWK